MKIERGIMHHKTLSYECVCAFENKWFVWKNISASPGIANSISSLTIFPCENKKKLYLSCILTVSYKKERFE
jgi:hypothetical protein